MRHMKLGRAGLGRTGLGIAVFACAIALAAPAAFAIRATHSTPSDPGPGNISKGQTIFNGYFCAACHTLKAAGPDRVRPARREPEQGGGRSSVRTAKQVVAEWSAGGTAALPDADGRLQERPRRHRDCRCRNVRLAVRGNDRDLRGLEAAELHHDGLRARLNRSLQRREAPVSRGLAPFARRLARRATRAIPLIKRLAILGLVLAFAATAVARRARAHEARTGRPR